MNITEFVWWSSRLRRWFRFNSWYLKGEKSLKKDVITVQLMFACLYHMKYKFPFIYWLTANILFCFPRGPWKISCLFRWASFLECGPCKVSILFGTCFKNIDLHGFMLLKSKCWTLYRVILFYVKNFNTETAAIGVAFFCLKLLRYFFFQNVHCIWDLCPIWSLGSLETFFLVIINPKKKLKAL